MAKLKVVASLLLLICFFRGSFGDSKPDDGWDMSFEFDTWPESESEEKTQGAAGKSIGHGHHEGDGHIAHIMDGQGQEEKGWQSGNYANYEDSCSSYSGKKCNPYNNLECRSDKCQCKQNPPHTYVRTQEKCFPIKDLDESCEFDRQCHDGKGGHHSRCNKRPGKCECHDGYEEVNGICLNPKNYNDPCETDDECQATMGEDAVCKPSSSDGQTEVCRCRDRHTWDILMKECLLLATGPGSTCKSDIQCTESKMGELSRCSRDTQECECYDQKSNNPPDAVYYKETQECLHRKIMGSPCSEHKECKASISSQAECLPKPGDMTMKLVCQCPSGKTCHDDVSKGVVRNVAVGLLGAAIGVALGTKFIIL